MIFHRILKKQYFLNFTSHVFWKYLFLTILIFIFCFVVVFVGSLTLFDKSLLVLFFKPDELVLIMGYYSLGEGRISVAVFDFTFHSNPNEML